MPQSEETQTPPDAPQVERRKNPAPVQVSVGTPGLPGISGIIAQWGAFGFVLFLCFMMWNSISTTQREDRAYAQKRDELMQAEVRAVRDEIRTAAATADKRDVSFLNAMTSVTTKLDSAASQLQSAVVELRATKLMFEAKLDKITDLLKGKMGECFVPTPIPKSQP